MNRRSFELLAVAISLTLATGHSAVAQCLIETDDPTRIEVGDIQAVRLRGNTECGTLSLVRATVIAGGTGAAIETNPDTNTILIDAPEGSEGSLTLSVVMTQTDGTEILQDLTLLLCSKGSLPLCTMPIPTEDLVDILNYQDPIPDIGFGGTTGSRMIAANLAVADILSQLDIDGDGSPDNAPDTDGDGLPDNWETGGFEALTADGVEDFDRVVFFPAPSAIVPGTPPTPIFTRLQIATDALNPDTDGDGLSDFVEVFGLMFIDENRNGLLDSFEWNDKNGDGLPSPGEHPIDNQGLRFPESDNSNLLHDFDGFVFTDPTNPDTDGDGREDGNDKDPLINPRAFGVSDRIIVRFSDEENEDIDKDGLGNGMDLGNDLVSTDGTGVLDFEVIDNPQNVRDLLEFFRQDLLEEGVVPEAQIEDLLGVDWDGNGLWKQTDVREWALVIDDECPADAADDDLCTPGSLPPSAVFTVGDRKLYAKQTFAELRDIVNDTNYKVYGVISNTNTAADGTQGDNRRIGLGWQQLLRPSLTTTTSFLPDPRVWAILYSWRVPGFDIDGDGFVGVPNIPSTAGTDCRGTGCPADDGRVAMVAFQRSADGATFLLSQKVPLERDTPTPSERAFDDRIEIVDPSQTEQPNSDLDGIITLPEGFRLCGGFGILTMLAIMLGLAAPRLRRRR